MLEYETPRNRILVSQAYGSSAPVDFASGSALNASSASLWKIIQSQQQQIAHVQRQIDRILDLLGSGVPSQLSLGGPYSSMNIENPSYRDQRGVMKSVRTSTTCLGGFPSTSLALPVSVSSELVDEVDSEEEDVEMSAEVEALIRKYSSIS